MLKRRSSPGLAALVATLVTAGALLVSGCSDHPGVPDYTADRSGPGAGAPVNLVLHPGPGDPVELPGAGPVMGAVEAPGGSGSLVVLTGPAPGIEGGLWSVPAGGAPVRIESIGVDAQYWKAAASRQVTAAWSLGPLPLMGPEAAGLSTGTRYGVVRDVRAGSQARQGYAGVRTDVQGGPVAPVTGVCGFSEGERSSARSFTSDGSSQLFSRLGDPLSPEAAEVRVRMQAGDLISVRPEQRALAARSGPGQRPRFTPEPEVAVAGLRSLSCLDPAAVAGLHAAGVTTGLRGGQGTAVAAVIDRGLADAWLTGGLGRPGELIGAARASGGGRLDGVLVDSSSGTAVAGLHLDLPADAQLSTLVFDADGRGGWYALAGSPRIARFSV